MKDLVQLGVAGLAALLYWVVAMRRDRPARVQEAIIFGLCCCAPVIASWFIYTLIVFTFNQPGLPDNFATYGGLFALFVALLGLERAYRMAESLLRGSQQHGRHNRSRD